MTISSILQSGLPLKVHMYQKVRSGIENRAAYSYIATARREALPNFCGKTATKVLADRKLQVYLLFLTSYIAVSAVEPVIYSKFLVFPLTISVYCLRTTRCHVTEFAYGCVY